MAARVRISGAKLYYSAPNPAAVATTSAVSASTVRIFLVGVCMLYSLGVNDYKTSESNAALGRRLLYSLIVHFALQIARTLRFVVIPHKILSLKHN